MSKTNEQSPYYRLLDLLDQHKSKLTAMRKELERLEGQRKTLGDLAVDAYLKKSSDYKEKKEAVSDNLIAIEAMKREIGYQENAIAKTEEAMLEEKKNEPARIGKKYQPTYNEAIRKLHKALLEAEKLEEEVQRIEEESKKELGRVGPPFNEFQSLRVVNRVLVPNPGEGSRKYNRMGKFEKECQNQNIEL